jgi:small subunit ribosomal protein S16
MAVHIRLQRHGATHRPFYHIVAADSRAPRNGRFIEKLGYYDPNTEPSVIEVKSDRLQYWYGVGAQLSSATAKLFKNKKINLDRTVAAKV